MPRNMIQPMRIELIDDDYFGDDLLGYLNVDLEECLNFSNEWKINKIFDIDGDEKMKKNLKCDTFGKIYI